VDKEKTMGTVEAVTQEAPNLKAAATSDVPLTGRWLVSLRWIAIAFIVLLLVLWVVAIPFRHAQLATVCPSANVDLCGDQRPNVATYPKMLASGMSLNFYAAYVSAVEVIFTLVYVVVAGIILLKKSNTRIGLFTAVFLITFSVSQTSTDALTAVFPVLQGPIGLLSFIGWACLGIFLSIFPDGRFVPRWTRFTALLWVVVIVLSALPFLPSAIFLVPLFGIIVATLIAQIYRYRYVSTIAQRQQTKWVVFATTAAIVGFLALTQLATIFLSQSPTGYGFLIGDTGVYLIEALIPVSIGVAILRSKLWDIDVVIRRTLVYSILTAILALIYFGLIIILQSLSRSFVNSTNNIALVGSTLAIAALFQPLRRRVQAIIDQRFYRRKYDAKRTLEAFSAKLREEVDLNTLSEHLLGVVEETMQPRHVSLWLCKTGREKDQSIMGPS
jgi:hypothetical protein